jgi:hypothetical protein
MVQLRLYLEAPNLSVRKVTTLQIQGTSRADNLCLKPSLLILLQCARSLSTSPTRHGEWIIARERQERKYRCVARFDLRSVVKCHQAAFQNVLVSVFSHENREPHRSSFPTLDWERRPRSNILWRIIKRGHCIERQTQELERQRSQTTNACRRPNRNKSKQGLVYLHFPTHAVSCVSRTNPPNAQPQLGLIPY